MFVNPNNSSRGGDEDYKKVIGEIKKEGVCPFCPENLARYHKNPILAEGEYWLLTDNMYPYKGAKHHILLVHKKHTETVLDLPKEELTELFDLVRSETKKRGIKGGTFFMRFGDTTYTGASVSHLHANLISPDVDDEKREPIIARVG